MNSKGFTLVELILVITLISGLAFVGASAFSPMIESWALVSNRSEGVIHSEYALDRMISEIAQLRDPQSVTVASANQFQFIDVGGASVQFSLKGADLKRNDNILARGVQSLSFSYWDINDVALSTPQVAPASTDIWRITVALSLQSGTQSITMRSQIHPRNLPRP